MKIQVHVKQNQQCVFETTRIDLSFDFATQSFSLSGAPVGVNVLCSAKPSSVIFGHSQATFDFESLQEALEFAEALKSAGDLVDDLCSRVMD